MVRVGSMPSGVGRVCLRLLAWFLRGEFDAHPVNDDLSSLALEVSAARPGRRRSGWVAGFVSLTMVTSLLTVMSLPGRRPPHRPSRCSRAGSAGSQSLYDHGAEPFAPLLDQVVVCGARAGGERSGVGADSGLGQVVGRQQGGQLFRLHGYALVVEDDVPELMADDLQPAQWSRGLVEEDVVVGPS